MDSMARPGGAVALVMLLALSAQAGSDLPVRRALRVASVVVETTGCAGVVAENPQVIVTAKHCVKGRTLRVRLSTGSERTAWVVAVNDAGRDAGAPRRSRARALRGGDDALARAAPGSIARRGERARRGARVPHAPPLAVPRRRSLA